MQNRRYGIGKVYCESWKAAYRNLLPQSYLDGLTPENCMPDAVVAAGCCNWRYVNYKRAVLIMSACGS